MFLNSYTGGVIGEVTEDGKTYATAPTPPVGDDSTKVATTAYVQDAVPSIPSGNVATWSRNFTCGTAANWSYTLKAPSGGTWFCWGNVSYGRTDSSSMTKTWGSSGIVIAGGGQLDLYDNAGSDWNPGIKSNNGMCIKIA